MNTIKLKKSVPIPNFKEGMCFLDDTDGRVYILALLTCKKYAFICLQNGEQWTTAMSIKGVDFFIKSNSLQLITKPFEIFPDVS